MDYARALFAGNADGHGFDHTMRVYRNAMEIARGEDCDRRIVALSALLHDADDAKLFHTADNANARAFLNSHGADEEMTERILAAVNAVSFSKNWDRRPDTVEGQIVQDADRLDAIGAVGIARTFAYGGGHGRGPEDSIRHFHEKLLLLTEDRDAEDLERFRERWGEVKDPCWNPGLRDDRGNLSPRRAGE